MQFGNIPGVIKPVSRLVQGTATDFNDKDIDAAFGLLDMAVAHGINTFDTAHVYGESKARVFGQWLAARGNREQVVILAKGSHHSDRPRVTPEDLTADLEDTLRWMEVDSVDLYVLHRDDPNYLVGPIVEALNALKDAGKAGTFGGSNWAHTRIAEANNYAKAHGLTPFAVSSPNFSLAEQVEEPWDNCVSISGAQGEAARRWYAQSDIALMTWSSLAGGFFSDRFHRDNLDTFPNDNYFAQLCIKCYCYVQNFQRLDRARALAEAKGMTVPQIALAFVTGQPMNIYALVSCANDAMFSANTAALDLKLTPHERDYLDLKADTPG